MTILLFWDRCTRARWSSSLRSLFALLLTASVAGATAEPPKSRAATAQPSVWAIKQGHSDLAKKDFASAAEHFRAARSSVPALADYLSYWAAGAAFEQGDFAQAIKDLDAFWKTGVKSPLVPDAAALGARAYRDSGAPLEAVRLLRRHYDELRQPEGDFELAASYAAADDKPSAAAYYQRVYFLHPATEQAARASEELEKLKAAMGDAYPPATGQMMFERAEAWVKAKYYGRARDEYEALLPRVAGALRDVARVRIGAADYLAFQTISAFKYLESLDVTDPAADAERLYYLSLCARRLDRHEEMLSAVDKLGRAYPKSPWRLDALIQAGNHHLVENRQDDYEPLYRACSDNFNDSDADYCHWKVTWLAYLNRRAEAEKLLREHLERFPGSEKASSALYFLGRLSENERAYADAKAYYQEILARFPNFYYADGARKRLAQPEMTGAAPAPAVVGFLKTIVWPVRVHRGSSAATAATRRRIERARLLRTAGLDAQFETELRFGAKTDAQPPLLAIELARAAQAKGSSFDAIRAAKSIAPGYLAMEFDDAPEAFWKLLFPLPYRAALDRYAKQNGLDPFVVAGLIRQESEFNPRAVSRSKAYGLTQILPSTGRDLLRKLRGRRARFRTSILLQPDWNLRLGALYLRQLYDMHGADIVPALAAYNAGGSRSRAWLTWSEFREPAEFIETIPFTETRNYVFSVLRNARIYQQLYGRSKPAPRAPALANGAAHKAAPKAKAAPKKKAAAKRTPAKSARGRRK